MIQHSLHLHSLVAQSVRPWPLRVGSYLVEDESLDELGVLDGSSDLLDDADEVEVDVGRRRRVDDAQHCVDGERRQLRGVVADDFAVERRDGRLDERLAVGQVRRDGDRLENFLRLVRRQQPRLADLRRVDTLLEQILSGGEQSAGQNDDGGGPVAGLHVLRARHVHQHLGGRVRHLHLAKNRSAVVGDENLAGRRSDHFVHALGSQRRADAVGDGLRGDNIRRANVLLLLATTEAHLVAVRSGTDKTTSDERTRRNEWKGQGRKGQQASAREQQQQTTIVSRRSASASACVRSRRTCTCVLCSSPPPPPARRWTTLTLTLPPLPAPFVSPSHSSVAAAVCER
jgi:hypothetical protein